MADDTFFQDTQDSIEGKTEDEGIQKVEKLKIGDGEYSQEELAKLVELGKIGQEAEEKYQTKIDKVWPNLQKTINEKKELQERLDAIENEAVNKKAETGAELSPEELAKQARIEAKKLGIATVDDFAEFYRVQRAGEKLLDATSSIVKEARELGKPQVSEEELLSFMQERGFKDPQDAYDIMFKDQLKKWETDKLSEVKPSGMSTISTSTAGGKQPTQVKVTNDNLAQLVAEGLKAS